MSKFLFLQNYFMLLYGFLVWTQGSFSAMLNVCIIEPRTLNMSFWKYRIMWTSPKSNTIQKVRVISLLENLINWFKRVERANLTDIAPCLLLRGHIWCSQRLRVFCGPSLPETSVAEYVWENFILTSLELREMYWRIAWQAFWWTFWGVLAIWLCHVYL